MKVLVLATNYPRPDGFISLQYIHTRNKWYTSKGIDVSVISFAAKYDYVIDNIKVYTLTTYKRKLRNKKFDILISHAPNLRDHYKFLKQYGSYFKDIVFFFHGHEVLETSKIYPKPYSYLKRKRLITKLRNFIYDKIKLSIWRRYFQKNYRKIQFVFVSNWMYKMFLKFVKLDPKIMNGRFHIIYNSVGLKFEKESYNFRGEKKYDFITIRNNIDGSKYSIDIVNRIAKSNPEYKFCVIGKGSYFKYNDKAPNLVWLNKTLSHHEIIRYLNKSKCALIPTRADAQGVMACEMATFGIPVITSNIDVCREVFKEFDNVAYIDNEEKNIKIGKVYKKILENQSMKKNKKYFAENTIEKEVELFQKLVSINTIKR